jgi:4'-phosphopantetheinyl transferase EntD
VRQAQPQPDGSSWRAGGLAALLPGQVCVEELRGDLSVRRDELLPAEWDVVRHAVERRRAEFAAVRGCARRAMARLGVVGGAILPGRSGAPVWPTDVVGSMTHTDGYCAAAVASATRVRALGIDAERHDRLEDGLRGLVLTDAERMGLGGLPTGTCWDMVSFSAKEAVFKAWYPLTWSRLGFQDVVLGIDPERGTFLASVLPVTATPGAAPPGMSFQGRFALHDGLVLTAVVVLRH